MHACFESWRPGGTVLPGAHTIMRIFACERLFQVGGKIKQNDDARSDGAGRCVHTELLHTCRLHPCGAAQSGDAGLEGKEAA